MDIVKHIKKHTELLQNTFASISTEQVKQLKLMALQFYFQLPQSQTIIEQYIKSPIDKEKLIAAIINGQTKDYREIMEKSTADVDEYADDYEELEQIPIFILNAFENAVADDKDKQTVVQLFLDIINTLDHYENFSDEPAYWNNLLEAELKLQNEILSIATKNGTLPIAVYQERYKDVDFTVL